MYILNYLFAFEIKGKECWAFTIKMFARIYSKKFGISEDKMMEKLWGDNYFDAKAKKWKNEGQDEEGNVYESGIYLYFEETPTAIVLVNVLMAG